MGTQRGTATPRIGDVAVVTSLFPLLDGRDWQGKGETFLENLRKMHARTESAACKGMTVAQ